VIAKDCSGYFAEATVEKSASLEEVLGNNPLFFWQGFLLCLELLLLLGYASEFDLVLIKILHT
jgi:hypothetical protein